MGKDLKLDSPALQTPENDQTNIQEASLPPKIDFCVVC